MQLFIFEYIKKFPEPFTGKTWLFVWLLFPAVCSFHSQGIAQTQDENLREFYNQISTIYSTDPLLVNGTVYLENIGDVKGHPYFLSGDWLIGDVFIRERFYPDQKLKYNLETDDLILNTGMGDSTFTTIRLNRALVDSFNIQGYHFVHFRKFSATDSLDKFFESFDGREFTFLRHHNKARDGKYSENSPGGSYNEMTTTNFIFKRGQLFKINSKREFYHFFADQKKDIRKYLRANHIKYRKATTPELKLLISHISETTQP